MTVTAITLAPASDGWAEVWRRHGDVDVPPPPEASAVREVVSYPG
jgi:hypothetical protein